MGAAFFIRIQRRPSRAVAEDVRELGAVRVPLDLAARRNRSADLGLAVEGVASRRPIGFAAGVAAGDLGVVALAQETAVGGAGVAVIAAGINRRKSPTRRAANRCPRR